MTLHAVQVARDAGRITVTANGRIDPELADREWAENTSVAAVPQPKTVSDGDAESFNDARARKETALADLAEMEAAELRGETSRNEEIAKCWGEMTTAFRARLLVLPPMAAPQVAAPGRTAEVQGILRKLVNEALQELSGDGIPESARKRARRHAEDTQTSS